MPRALLLAAVLLGVSTAPPPAGADPAGPVVVTPPLAAATGYAPPVVTVPMGGMLTLVNADLVRHNIVHDSARDGFGRPKDRPWCDRFVGQPCPVFFSELAGLGQSKLVQGLADLEPGRVYSFTCELHDSMRGTLVALPDLPV